VYYFYDDDEMAALSQRYSKNIGTNIENLRKSIDEKNTNKRNDEK
jgi:hypothetical protein